MKNVYPEIDGIRYSKYPITINYNENIYPNQYRDLKLFCREYVGEQLLSPIITYDKMKTYYPIQLGHLTFQVDYITPKKIGLFDEYDENPNDANLRVTLVKQRENKVVSDGNRISAIEVFRDGKNDNT